MKILTNIVVVSLLSFIGFYLFYCAICLRYIKTRRSSKEIAGFRRENFPNVSIIIPVYNEIRVISRKMANLQDLRYPKDKLEVVFVDGGSIDGTADLIENTAKNGELSVKVVRQGLRKGFNSAIIESFGETTGEIILITGAETEYDSRAVDFMVQHFADPQVGAVTGRQIIKNIQEGFSPKLEVAYRNLYDFIREAESYIDSPFDIKGEIAAARRSVCKHLIEKPQLLHKGCIDACFSFQATMDGYKTVFEPNAVYYELSPRSIRDSFRQQVRRAATLIQNMLVFKNMIMNKAFGAFGTVIMPAHLLMLAVLPFFFLAIVIGSFAMIILSPSNYLFLALVIGGVAAAVLSRRFQAFVRVQLVLVIAALGLLAGIETQKFERLLSARP